MITAVRKPDQFTKMVLQAAKNKHGRHVLFLGIDQVDTLLRRQFAQMRRVVKAMPRYSRLHNLPWLVVDENGVFIHRDDLLRDLDAYKRVTK